MHKKPDGLYAMSHDRVKDKKRRARSNQLKKLGILIDGEGASGGGNEEGSYTDVSKSR